MESGAGEVLVAIVLLEGFWLARNLSQKGSLLLKRLMGAGERAGRGWGGEEAGKKEEGGWRLLLPWG